MRLRILSAQAILLIPVVIKRLAIGVGIQNMFLRRLCSIQKRCLFVKGVYRVEDVIDDVTEIVACHSCVQKLLDVTKKVTNASLYVGYNSKSLLSQLQFLSDSLSRKY